MHFTLVNSSQVVMHAQVTAVLASIVCGGFATYLLAVYRGLYPASTKFILASLMVLVLVYLEKTRHMALADIAPMSYTYTACVAMGACFASMAFGLLMLLLVMNHDRLVRAVRHTFMESSSILRTSKISQLTITQKFRIVETSNFNDTLRILDLISKPSAARLLRVMTAVGWMLIAANACFMAILEMASHL